MPVLYGESGLCGSGIASFDLLAHFVAKKHSSNMNDSSCYMNDLCLCNSVWR